MLGFLDVRPFRGDQVAAGVVALTVLVALVLVRSGEDLGDGGSFALALAACAFVTTLGARTVRDPHGPRGYHVALFVCSWVLALLSLLTLAELGDADLGEARTVLWIALALCAAATWWARDRDSSTMTLLAALSGVVAVVAFGEWTVEPGLAGDRWLLAGSAAVLGFAALARRDHRPAHAAQLANAGGLATAAILATALADAALGAFAAFVPGASADVGPDLATGWELVGVGVGFGLVGYGAVDKHRGPVLVGVLVLTLWVVVVGAEGGLVGWPLALALGAGFLLVVGLRPSTPLPPPPDETAPPAPVSRLPTEPEL